MKTQPSRWMTTFGLLLWAVMATDAYPQTAGVSSNNPLYQRWSENTAPWQQRPAPGGNVVAGPPLAASPNTGDRLASPGPSVVAAGYTQPQRKSPVVRATPSRLTLATDQSFDSLSEMPFPADGRSGGFVHGGEVMEPYYPGAVHDGYFGAATCAACGDVYDCGCDGMSCGYGSWNPCYVPLWVHLRNAWHRHGCGLLLENSSIYAGVQGFKSQPDGGKSNNFGFHEGFNLSGPIDTCLGIGFQAGLTATQSNLSGNEIEYMPQRRQREQVFYTLGIYRRAVCGGLQWGVVYDGLQDNYYSSYTLGQVRTEISWLSPCHGEVGFYGAFHVKTDTFRYRENSTTTWHLPVESYDYYTFFYRRSFDNGGQGRIYVGTTNWGGALLGAEYYMPLTHRLALNNSIAYLVPKEGRGQGGLQNESWNLSIGLVLTRDCMAYGRSTNPFQPLMNVADNASLIPHVF